MHDALCSSGGVFTAETGNPTAFAQLLREAKADVRRVPFDQATLQHLCRGNPSRLMRPARKYGLLAGEWRALGGPPMPAGAVATAATTTLSLALVDELKEQRGLRFALEAREVDGNLVLRLEGTASAASETELTLLVENASGSEDERFWEGGRRPPRLSISYLDQEMLVCSWSHDGVDALLSPHVKDTSTAPAAPN